ncbi:unnamed protein product [Cuscuta europaea]|uniref:Thioesterase domain-containing protein n=1 Tax=Cuscuta europaea TaxID=41803 RepID=A0A9P1EK71_CUSEU|nr:unnamed protein product [Cuscuta europaea]
MAESSPSKEESLDAPLHTIGFEIGDLSPEKVTGRLQVTPKCCQPFKVLHGGVSALIAEALASIGAHMASGFRRVAGVHLSIHHLRPARVGDALLAEATPVNAGRTIQVWGVNIWKAAGEGCGEEKGVLISSARVTVMANMHVPEHARDAAENLKKYAKL